MSENWREILQHEPIEVAPRPEFRDQLRRGLIGEWHGRPMILSADPARETDGRRRRVWLLAAAAATILVVGGLVVATRPSSDPTVLVPAGDPEPPLGTTPVTPTTAGVDDPTASTVVVGTIAGDPAGPPAGVDDPTVSTVVVGTIAGDPAAPPTTAFTASAGAIAVPLAATAPVPIEPIATVGYGPADEQVEVPNGEFPPPAVWHVGGVLVLEDDPRTGLTGEAVIVQTGPDDAFEDAGEQRFIPTTIDVAEPGGTPIAVRSLDGGGIVVVTVHADDPQVRIRRYDENPPGLFTASGDGADREALGDSELRITGDGATWGGEVVVPQPASNPGAVRPVVTVDPPSGFSSTLRIERLAPDGAPATVWTLEVELDPEFPPGSASPLVEPFGDGALVTVAGSTAPAAQATLAVLRSDGTGTAYALDGWVVADVRPEGALLTRSTPTGLELATLPPPS